ncbi:uncharacterized protein K452DRAFT_320996 [Aplosporella prunicola CBS 121167]|uniref:ABC transporter domain-containing protein n=1 Tax=Aplosporella prunicola CBS 121167 TaxID=1176127 RepID=A0A6A6B7F3_9PEZI|nr:uncharacterized protein K452DRAFT_320996 [Aplosporella prunicola CBS 121167]KAF2138907.1 hypothetical protein K452DRAFT_320996 [Aplosporella prunicola CBS 121167]
MNSKKDLSTPSVDLPLYQLDGRDLGVVFEDVRVYGRDASERRVPDFLGILTSICKLPARILQGAKGKKHSTREILQNVSGVVFPGENLLVIGRPGSGCTSVLKILANERQSFEDVQGTIAYAGLPSSELAKRFGSEIIFNGEEDIHFPRLAVKHTIDFALRLRQPAYDNTPQQRFSEEIMAKLLLSVGISHTKDTIVGDSFVRGVSGGERKRVSLLEALATNPVVASWDNPNRGLDSSSTLQFFRLLRSLAKTNGMTNIVTAYQLSDTIYHECFDRVMVMYEGRMIYTGSINEARQYFIDLGFQNHETQTTPDFLASVTSPEERVIRPDHHGPVPQDPDSLAEAFRKSQHFSKLRHDMATYRFNFSHNASLVENFCEHAEKKKSWFNPKTALTIRSIFRQTMLAARRNYQLLWGDRFTFLTILAINAINAVVSASAMYEAPKTSTGSFIKGGSLFFSSIYFFLNALTEVSSTVNARNILVKQHKLGLLHPISFAFAQTFAQIPLALVQSLVFCCCYYFMLGTVETASHFWIFLFIVFVHYNAVSSLFRMLGAWSPNLNIAMLVSGISMPICLLYSGYAVPVPTMHKWGSWIRRIAPSPYSLEALMANEFASITLHCTDSELIPNGPGYTDLRFQGCPIPGTAKGSAEVSGTVFLAEQYSFKTELLWQDVGIIIAMWFIYTILSAIGLTITTRETGNSGGTTYKRGASVPSSNSAAHSAGGHEKADIDIENEAAKASGSCSNSSRGSRSSSKTPSLSSTAMDGNISKSPANGIDPHSRVPFTFSNVNYTISGKQLLNNINGYVKPGQLTALMGASGAGKTTLLDTISQRKHEGTVDGQMLLGGHPIDETFGRACGFCMQQDVHEPTATVREAVQFSAHMRQPAHISALEKDEYVEHVIHLLNLENIADAIIGTPGNGGLGVEARKRVTIAVELAARPPALLFLDEPTSGLDSQAAFSLVRLLQRIAAEGMPIICTIHQPSALIFEMFDHILLLAPGGETVYFGETGENSHCIIDYFARAGLVVGSSNPAEFIISAVGDRREGAPSLAQVWRESPECKELGNRIAALNGPSAATAPGKSADKRSSRFALPLSSQILAVSRRHSVAIWRNGFYLFSKFAKAIATQLFIAFSFYNIGSDMQGLQNHTLAYLIIAWVIPASVADIQDLWFAKWDIYEAREKNGIYDWKALCIALIIVEIPWHIAIYTLIFFCTHWTMGLSSAASVAGFDYLMFLLLGLFSVGFPQCIAALFPTPTLSGYASSFFWVVLMSFSGIVVPHTSLDTFYRPWIFWADPMRYYFGANSENVLHNKPAECSAKDWTVFDPPGSQTCGEYMADFLKSHTGYLRDETATTDCHFCKFSTGDDFAATLDFHYGDRWRDFAVFLGFCITTILLTGFATWFYRGRKMKVKSS